MTTPTEQAAPAGAVDPSTRVAPPGEQRSMDLAPKTFNAEQRTVDVVASSGASVRRRDYWTGEEFDELLVVSAEAVDLTRCEAGSVPVLNRHWTYDISNVLGTCLAGCAQFEDGKLILTLKFSGRDEVAPIVSDVGEGIIRNVSVGYRVLAYEVDETTSPKTRRITKWELLEVSLVPVGADGFAGTRSMPEHVPASPPPSNPIQAAPVTVNVNIPEFTRAPAAHSPTDNHMENRMSVITEQPAAPQPSSITENRAQPTQGQPVQTQAAPTAPAPQPEADPLAAMRAAEADRIAHIQSRAACAQLGLPSDMIARAITEGWSLDAFNRAVIDHVAAQPSNQRNINPHVQVIADEGDTRIRAATTALLNRSNPARHKLDGAATEYRGIKLLDLARDVLESHGTKVRGMSGKDIARRAFQTTSDFPAILSGVTNISLREGYEMAPRTFLPWAAQMMATDFKDLHLVQFGGGGVLPKVNEQGEFARGKLYESKESFRVHTFGEIIGITRQVIVNDQLDALTRVPREAGYRAAVTENSIVYGILLTNPAMSDGKTLFHAGHGNLSASGTALSLAGLSSGREAMRKQKALDGKTVINTTPRHLLVPAALETKAEQLIVVRNTPASTEQAVPEFFRSLNPIVEPLLDASSATAWYLLADPASSTASIAYAYLEGEEGVYLEEEQGFDVDGMKIKVRHDFGAGAMDFRGAYKDPGAAPSP
ncbi:prohead protease/major capsid protein fusion protein [Azospirillum brasilense]|uniref:prohead protease/major capsid protein fusion protein n=1 Tax=Azospirillum brasilense TaxID=192 RepID=UPI001EDBF9F5|nr:prohead protease/major capsid protein fusion protein [Azospirillum brasilense]UKJ74502.1 HK97 family phage prohead protease [Azospirillum brasilense]